MNIFQFFADMLHLASFLLLINRIHKTKSVQGWLSRNILSNPRNLSCRFRVQISRFVLVLGIAVQYDL